MTIKKAKIAVVMPRLSRYGGAEGFAWRFSGALAAEGYHVDFICARCETAPPEGVNPIILGRHGPFKWFKVLRFARQSVAARKQGNYDLSFGLGKTPGHDILRVGGGPQRNFWKLSISAWPKGPTRKMKSLRRRLSPANWIIQWLEKERLKNSPQIVCVSELVCDWMCAAHPSLRREDIRVIYNKPDMKRFYPVPEDARMVMRRQAGISDAEIVLGSAGTNFALKGVATLVRAMAHLPENFRLRIAGGRNPSQYQALAKRLGVADRVTFLGKVDDMATFYACTDIFVLPTFYDACSNAVVEALGCGCRVISTRYNGSSIFLPPERILNDPADEHELTAAVRRAATQWKREAFAWPEDVLCGIEPYLELVRDILKEKSGDS